MSRDLNKVMITGRLGRPAELRVTPNGSDVASFSVASSRSQKVGDEWKEQTEWFRIVAWNKLALICGKNLIKGTHVYVEGRLQTRDWQDNDGNKRSSVEVIAEELIILGGGARQGGGQDDIGEAFDQAQIPRTNGYQKAELEPEDIPF